MYEEIEEEFQIFKQDFENGRLTFGRYFDENAYEDEYSHNQIDEFQGKFIEKVKAYLHEHAPGRYVVSGGWCVFVMTLEEAQKRNLRHLKHLIVR